MDSSILLESGSNELEILEFRVGNCYYGINVAKVREVLNYLTPTPVPNVHPTIEGIFMPRDKIITVIDLAKSLKMELPDNRRGDMLIVTNFNELSMGFHVQEVIGIHRVSWSNISRPDATIMGQNGQGCATGIIKLGEKLIIILDFERIIADINIETSLKVSDIENINNRRKSEQPIVIAEDSPLLSEMLHDCLKKAGYVNLTMTTNGQDAWNLLCNFKKSGNVKERVALVITDIEMPLMDGHCLTRQIKSDAELQSIPVIIFSSLINPEMKKKGESVGADVQLAKPEIGNLVKAMDQLLEQK